jgi:hypothetical protein
VTVEPLKTGRKVSGVRLRWSRKAQADAGEALAELRRPKGGRRARIAGTVEAVAFRPPAGEIPRLMPETCEQARRRFPGYDMGFLEQEWRAWTAGQAEPPAQADRAFLGFCARYVARHPLS